MSEVSTVERLRKVAETLSDASVRPFGSRGDELLGAIQGLQARDTYRPSWVICLGDDLVECWPSLSLEAQLTAFIVAASFSASLDGPAGFEAD